MGILILKKSKMKHVAAYALLVLGGTAVPEPQQVMDLLKEAGVTADKGRSRLSALNSLERASMRSLPKASPRWAHLPPLPALPLLSLVLPSPKPLPLRKHRTKRRLTWIAVVSSAVMTKTIENMKTCESL